MKEKKHLLPRYAFNYSLMSTLALRFLDNLEENEEKYFDGK